MKPINWKPKEVLIGKIKPTPDNFKIKTDLGKERLSLSMKLFGNASTVILNQDYCLIDGNSRWEEEKEKGVKKMWVMWPSRKLTPKEYKEFSALFDTLVAGTVDTDRINSELGTSKAFFDKWKMEIPLHMREKLSGMGKGKKAPDIKQLEYPSGKAGDDMVAVGSNIMMVQLFFTAKQETEFRKYEEKLMKKWKTKNTTETVLKAIKTCK